MTKFHKIQKYSSIIPFCSTIFIVFVTMFEFKKQRASKKLWISFLLTFFLSASAVYILNAVVMTGQHWVLNVIASGLILTIANILFVDMQIKSIQNHHEKQQKSNTSKIIIICCILIGVTVISVVILISMLLNPSVDIKDTNGNENTNLAIINSNDILSTLNNYSSFASSISRKGANTNVERKLKEYDFQEVLFSSKKISGIMTLQTTKTMCNQLVIEVDSQLETGNMEIVIIVDDQYYDHIPVNQHSVKILSDVKGKTVIVKIAAESANTNVSVKRTEVK